MVLSSRQRDFADLVQNLWGGRFGKVILWVRGVRGDLMHNMVVLVTLHGGPIIMQNFLSMCVVL